MNLIEAESVLLEILEHLELCHTSLFDDLCHPKDDIVEALNVVLTEIEEAANKLKRKANAPENHGKPWSDAEKERLTKLFIKEFDPNNGDLFYAEASRKFKRKIGGIKSCLQKMELISHPYRPAYAIKVLCELRRVRRGAADK
jgi:hypothetical protein